MTSPTCQLRRGFTLIELLLVCATIAIVTAMAVPRYGQALSNYRVRCAAQRVAVDLAAAAGQAVASSASVTVSFDRKTNAYRVGASGELVRLSDEPYVSWLDALEPGRESIVFDGYGAPDGGFSVVVRSGEAARTVTVDPVTGKASVK